MTICFILCISGIHLASHCVISSRLYSFVFDNSTHFFIYHVDSQGKYEENYSGRLFYISPHEICLRQHWRLFLQLLLLACCHTRRACLCALQTSHKATALQFGSLQDQLVRDEKKSSIRTVSGAVWPLIHQSLTCSRHSESNHVLRDSEFQGISQDRLQFDSLLSARAFTVTVHNMTSEILKQLK